MKHLNGADWFWVSVAALFVVFFAQFPFFMAPAFVTMFADFGMELPPLLSLVLSGWFPMVVAASAGLALAAALSRRPSLRARRWMIACSISMSAIAFCLFFWAWHLPDFTFGRVVA